jgi:hypothetical protein
VQALHGIMFGVDATKSIILTLACLERRLTVRRRTDRISTNFK